LDLYLSILSQQEELQKSLELISGKYASLFKIEEDKLRLMLNYHLKLNQLKEANALYKTLIEKFK
jgi:hypothetical protein